MGRKIPGKKHRTVKDPEKQHQARYDKIKHKVNRKPLTDDQEIPSNIKRISEFRRNYNNNNDKVTKNRKNKHLLDTSRFVSKQKELPGMTRKLKMLPVVKQGIKESDKNYLRRVHDMTKTVLKEAIFEDKFNVEVERDAHGVVTRVKKREYNDPLITDKDKKIKENKLAKKKKRREQEKLKKQKKLKKSSIDESDLKEYQFDKVEFGEVVHEPPKLNTIKLDKNVTVERDSKIDGFLFMKKLQSSSNSNNKQSMARRSMLEEEREKAVEAYRLLKAEKQAKFLAF